MSSYLSNLLTTTTSRYNSLRRNLLDNEADGDTEDDSHIARVLRAYYQEKGRPFPPWLPPDPRAPSPAPTQQFVRSTGPQAMQPPGSRGGLSDLWDPPASQTPPPQPGSLRSRAPPRGGPGAGRGGFLQPEPSQGGGRPLPSQRAGSYQSSFSQGSRPSFDSQPPGSAGSGSAQDRLKARLWGSGRSGSPTGSASSSPAGSPGVPPTGSRNPFERAASANSGGRWAGGNFDEGSGGDISSSSGGGGGGGGGSGRGRIGLPSGPRAYR